MRADPDCDKILASLASHIQPGDPGWREVWGELLHLHFEKSKDYGTDDDKLANYVQTSESVGEPDEYSCWLRIHEKTVRALNLIRAGRADENLEGPDVAAMAIAAEALRERRFPVLRTSPK